jgi:asparagine synthase (glutamine-hydrolysing)
MCGIAGIIDFSLETVPKEKIHKMVAAIQHRGPDDAGVYTSGPVGLGHARLSIIDLSSNGHQPMVSDVSKCVLVFNGEIYNYRTIKRELENKGHSFASNSDTETILNAYLEWGSDSFSKLEGMFAFALWDGRSKQLHLVRDRFGIKPLYYYSTSSGVVFGSEVKALLASGCMERSLNWEALNEYLHYGASLGENSMFEGVRKLLPGHRIIVDCSGLKVLNYSSIYDVTDIDSSASSAIIKVRHLMDEAVQSHIVSDVPVGVFLSGGIDSSAITALAAKHYKGRLSTYSVGFDYDKGVNELSKAKNVADYFGTDHHELYLRGQNMPDVIERLVRCHDEPFGDIADIPLYLLCEELKGTAKVILQGDGGDEIFAGYRHYNVLSFERTWHFVSKIAWMLRGVIPKSQSYYRYMRFFQAMSQNDPALRMALLMTEEPYNSSPTRVLSHAARQRTLQFNPYARYQDFYERFKHLDPVQRMLYTDCGVMLPDIFLEKVDKATMAHGIEVRVPMLDTKLTQYVMGLPSSYKVKFGDKKWILKQAMRGIVPDSILDAPKKGFGVPYAYWLRTSMAPYMKSVLLDPETLSWGLFDKAAIELCIKEHIEGKRNNGFLLYKLLVLALWYKFYLAN